MRSDMKALMKVVGAGFVAALVIMGVILLAALNVVSPQTAAVVALCGILAGGILIGRRFSRQLLPRPGPPAEPDEPRRVDITDQ